MKSPATKSLTLLIVSSVSTNVFAEYKGPMQTDPRPNAEIYSQYCTGNPDSTEVPGVNYANATVKEAAKRLSAVAPLSFYFYGAVKRAYGLVKPNGSYIDAPADAPSGTTPEANAFLVQLCGEFRDRASMIEAKLLWTTKLNKLPAKKQQATDPKKNPWLQMTAESYMPYLTISREIWLARQELVSSSPYKLDGEKVDQPVKGFTVCETKYIFSEYLSKNQSFKSLDKFEAGVEKFAKQNCSADDKVDFYDFRGDSNFKPNSPESNGMIWYAKTISSQCKDLNQAKPNSKIKDEDCQRYFRSPFQSRWNAARAGLAAWLWRDRSLDPYFGDTKSLVTITPHLESTIRPFDFFTSDAKSKFNPSLNAIDFQSPDLGVNKITKGKPDLKYRLLRDAVNRHTDWYASGYNDGVDIDITEAYSPFVASSYEMSASNGFTQPGATVNSPSDGRKHWMFVFRIKGSNWYNSKSAKEDKPVNFDTDWFDETSLGNNGLADSERAWDRLGTALEGDLDSILYLHNVTTSEDVQSDGMTQLEFPVDTAVAQIAGPTPQEDIVEPAPEVPQQDGQTTYVLKLAKASFPKYDPAESEKVFYRGKVFRRLRDRGVESEISSSDVTVASDYVLVPITLPNGESLAEVLATLAKDGIKPYNN